MTPICLQRKIIPALELRPPSAIPLLEADPVSLVRDLMKAKYPLLLKHITKVNMHMKIKRTLIAAKPTPEL